MSKKSVDILSDIVVFMKYAKYLKTKLRRETWSDLTYRNRDMHLDKYPQLHAEILNVYNNFVMTKKVLPSMRSMQFAGKPIELSPNRIYNCCFLPMDDWRCFSETMFLLLGGTGVGYSVQSKHVEKLPEIIKPTKTRRYLIGDSIEGWADAVKALFKAYMKGASLPKFDFSDIREKGALLVTSGGKAPGPEPLKTCLFKIKTILDRKQDGEQLTTLEVHDIQCLVADAVLAGGIRRAAMISLFDMDDNSMLTCKYGNWWETNPQRGRANNSAVVMRHRITEKEFKGLWSKIEASGSGEPGIYLSNNADWGTNPCCFTGDTLLKTENGFENISGLKNKTFKAYNVRNELVEATAWSNGFKDVVKIKFSSGETIRSTDDHRFMLNNGDESQAKDLKGKRLMPSYVIRKDNDEFTKLGFLQGDANLTRLDSDSHLGLEINIGEDDLDIAELFNIDYKEGKKSYYTRGYNEICKDLQFQAKVLPERALPQTYVNWSTEQKSSFLRGIYSANGCIITKSRVSFKGTCLELIEGIKDSLENDFDISSYVTTNKPKKVKFSNGTYTCKESYDLNIGRFQDVVKFAENIGFIHQYKLDSLEETIKEKSPLVLSVKSDGNEEVFDFNLDDDTHWGVVSSDSKNCGYIAHNCEIALRPYQFCNLTEINANDVVDQKDLEERSRAAAFIGTLQAGYSDFHYLRDVWKRTTEKDALIGVSMTGIASGAVLNLDLEAATNVVIEENKRVAKLIGINSAARTTCVKPAGTTSLVIGSSSGIHAWHSPYYIRRVRVGKNESIYQHLIKTNPELLEDEFFNPTQQAVISVPVKAPSGSIFRNESPIELLERVKKFSLDWVKTGHIKGENTHNVSATISVKDDEWEEVGEWMWENKACYNGLSVLPYDGGSYKQAPFETISKEVYEKMIVNLREVDLTQIEELEDATDLTGEAACSGPSCDVK